MRKILFFAFFLNALFAKAQTAQSVLEEMLTACDHVQSLQFTMSKKERMAAKSEATNFVKYKKAPFSVYLKSKIPDSGMEILFVKGWNNNKAFINPGGFPYVNVSLSPFANRMRTDGHFTLYDIGFETLTSNLRNGLKEINGKVSEYYTLDGTVNFNGRICDKLIMENKTYKWIKYTAAKDILLTSLAMEKHLSAYSIKERNNLSDFGTIKAGTTLLIPSTFIKKVILYVDKTTRLPIMQEMHDDKGFFAHYEFRDLLLNPKFEAIDFSRENKTYKF
jgi:outer membrane lipoprotein-sorting protein